MKNVNREIKAENTPYKGRLYQGTLWCLKTYDKITIPQISGIIGWNTKKVSDEVRRIMQTSLLTFFIEEYQNDKGLKVLSLDDDFKQLTLNGLAKLGRTLHDRNIRYDKIKQYKKDKRKATTQEVLIKQILFKLRTNFIFNDHNKNNSKITFDGRVPDFIDINNKKIIEYFGRYYHGFEFRKLAGDLKSDEEHEIDRILHYTKYGYKTLIIWEDETKDLELLEKTIYNFVNDIPCLQQYDSKVG